MNAIWPILAMAAGVYVLRVSGLALRDVAMPAEWERALRFLPVAVLTALVVTSLAGRAENRGAGIAAAVGAAVVARRSGRMWASIAGGAALYWLFGRI